MNKCTEYVEEISYLINIREQKNLPNYWRHTVISLVGRSPQCKLQKHILNKIAKSNMDVMGLLKIKYNAGFLERLLSLNLQTKF